jgi:hypothetical protein
MNERHNTQDVIIVEDETLREGFTQIPNALLRRSDLSPGAKLTYMALLSYAWQQGQCFPGQDRLAQDLGAGKRSVIRYLQELTEARLLKVQRRGLGQTNLYILLRFTTSTDNNRPVRSAKLAHPEMPKATLPEMPILQLEKEAGVKDPQEKNPGEKTSNIRISTTGHLQLQEDDDTETSVRQPGTRQKHEESSHETRMQIPVALLPQGIHRLAEVTGERYKRRGSVPSKARQAIGAYIHDFALEFGDQAPLRSTITRAVRLYGESGLSLGEFISSLHAARSVVKEYSGSIRKGRGEQTSGWKPVNKVPYFFAVLEDQLGLRERPSDGVEPDLPQEEGALQRPTPAWRTQPARAGSGRQSRRSIGGPLVPVISRSGQVAYRGSAADGEDSSESTAATRKRPKSGGLDPDASNGLPEDSHP